MVSRPIEDCTVVSNTESATTDAIRNQIRGSGLLLSGSLLSSLINFATQVLIARYLSLTTFGAWAYALSIIALFQVIAKFGLTDAMTRFVPIYHETRDYRRMFGTIVLAFSTVLAGGAIIVGAFHLLPGPIANAVHAGPRQFELLLIMIFLVPADAADALLMGLFASLASPRSIFFRKHVLAPGLKFTVAVLLILFRAKVEFLAFGFVTASVLGALIYGGILLRLLHSKGLLQHFDFRTVQLPKKELFTYALPGLTSDIVTILHHTVAVVLLGYFHDMQSVAYFRVVLPAAAMNTTVMLAFTLLFTPAAARMLARADRPGINKLYWQTAVWVSVLSFPIFAVTFCFARPLTVFLFGARYAPSAVCMAMLSLGYYFNAALGFNGLTLKVLGKIRYLVIINVVVALTNIAANLLLIPRYGATGAAFATGGTMILHNILKQAGLRLASGVSIFEWQYLSFYAVLAGGTAGLFLISTLRVTSIYLGSVLAGVVSCTILMVVRKNMKIAETFPESLRVPLVRSLLA